MKKVLIVTYYAPPVGMAGVLRVTKLAKFLPEFGWQPILLTVKPISYFLYDPDLLNDLAGITIYRSESLDPARLLYFFRKDKPITVKSTGPLFINYLLFPDAKVLWVPFAVSLGKKLIEQEKPSLIFATAPPYSALLIGVYLKNYARIPLVSDFRDAYPTGFTPPPIHFRYPVALLRRHILKKSDAIVAVNQGTATKLEKKAIVIENGYDPDEFSAKDEVPSIFATIPPNHLTIFYAGTLWENEDALFAFLEAAKGLKNLKVLVAGRASIDCQSRLRAFSPIVNYLGVLSHQVVISLMKKADILLYLTKPNQPAGIKLYEYFGAGKPILAVCEGCNEAVRLIEHHNAGLVSSLSPDEIKSTLLAIIEKKGNFCNQSALGRYNRKKQAERLAELFNSLTPTTVDHSP
uniref:Glycosyltransferase n=1 Tax=candidate division WOR-3 bacterium TaxID=2052148 RepID=A0A7C6AA17_UNCW3